MAGNENILTILRLMLEIIKLIGSMNVEPTDEKIKEASRKVKEAVKNWE